MQSKKIAHLTSVHPRNDTRIFLKECQSLAAAGYQVSLVVADGKGDENNNDVQICDVGVKAGRLKRMTVISRRVLARALQLDADIYHLHDPELLVMAGFLRRKGKIVIFDAHEDVPAQILGKHYLHPVFRQSLSRAYGVFEARICPSLDAVVAATPFIKNKFQPINRYTVEINNYPMLGDLASPKADRAVSGSQVCYVGAISEIRGIREVVQAVDILQGNARLKLCGRFGGEQIEGDVKGYPGWKFVDEAGWLGRDGIRDVLRNSVAGLVTFYPLPNHIDAQPTKMFEYMSAAVPVIASDFPLWRGIIEGSDCGICVNPQEPQAIAEAIDYLVNNPERARQMGANGWHAVQDRYNWLIEEQKLLDLYERLMRKRYM
jgi:glycosyltransferase involved in cell wall biosynthesis